MSNPLRLNVSIQPLREREAEQCELILRALPEWFGNEESIVQYRKDIATMSTYVAKANDNVVGFVTIHEHNEYSAEVHLIAVLGQFHRDGIGRMLVEHVEHDLRDRGFEFLQVKTVGPSKANEAYAKTRQFYIGMGFRPLEENKFWGEGMPCLVLVKSL